MCLTNYCYYYYLKSYINHYITNIRFINATHTKHCSLLQSDLHLHTEHTQYTYQCCQLSTVLQNRYGSSVVDVGERDAIDTGNLVTKTTTQNTLSHTAEHSETKTVTVSYVLHNKPTKYKKKHYIPIQTSMRKNRHLLFFFTVPYPLQCLSFRTQTASHLVRTCH